MGRRFHLNMWQRLGVVASVIWAIGAYSVAYTRQSAQALDLAWFPCNGGDWTRAAPPHCGDAEYALLMNDAWAGSLFVAVAPVFAVWLLAYMVIWVARWVWAGRRQKGEL